MKDFEKIDWNKYNKPPYYQQWLCRDDTLKLARFGDRGLGEVDDQILALKDTWDIDNISGHFLDRIGKLLNEPRNGNDDDNYRILLKLRRLLNTNSGSVNDIIKVIKYFYQTETIEIKPNYPAGISILCDGEGPPLDFNKIIVQVVGAGIAYDTKELFNFIEDMPINEIDKKIVRKIENDSVSQFLLRNGRVLRDGKTVFNTQLDFAYRNGVIYRNGETIRNGTARVPAVGTVYTPIYRHSGMQDVLTMTFGDGNYIDTWYSQLKRNRAVVRDGSATRNGYAPYSMNDAIRVIKIDLTLKDYWQITDKHETTVNYDTEETINRNILRNGRIKRNKQYYRSSNGMVDPFTSHCSETNIVDGMNMTESVTEGLRYHWFRNNKFKRDGSVTRKGMIFIPLE